MTDESIHDKINALAEEEQALRERLGDGEVADAEALPRLQQIELERDQAWDLLRQREALRDAGQDPDAAELRPPEVVEGYES